MPDDSGLAPPNTEQDALRSAVRQVMAETGLNQADVSRESGVAYGTLTGWMAGTYSGKTERVAHDVKVWLDARAERTAAKAALPEAPGFQMTTMANRIIGVLQYAQAAPDFAVISAGAGVGKTTTISRYQATNPNVWVATMDESTSKLNGMLVELCASMSVSERSPGKLRDAICRKLQRSGGLLIVDEAQHLETRAFNQLRSIHDRCDVGIAVVGNDTVYSRLEGEGRKPAYAQLFSRIGMRLTRPKPYDHDIAAMIAAWGVKQDDEVRLLTAIARKPGALRGLNKTMTLAGMIAAGAGVPCQAQHIRQAWKQLSPPDPNAAGGNGGA